MFRQRKTQLEIRLYEYHDKSSASDPLVTVSFSVFTRNIQVATNRFTSSSSSFPAVNAYGKQIVIRIALLQIVSWRVAATGVFR